MLVAGCWLLLRCGVQSGAGAGRVARLRPGMRECVVTIIDDDEPELEELEAAVAELQ